MEETARKAADDISITQKELLTNQESLSQRQSKIGGMLQNNMEDILKEKKMIAEKHVQVEEYTKMINQQLGRIIKLLIIIRTFDLIHR